MLKKIYIIIVGILMTVAMQAQLSNDDFIEIQSGSFSMGNTSYSREQPVRTLAISTFYLSKKVITNSQYATFINEYGNSTVKDGKYAGQKMFVSDSWGIVEENGQWKAASGYENYPAIHITWYGANEFCKYYGGRLPTEAEWEYAAKGGKNQISYTYSGSNTATTVAWYYDNSSHINHAVGLKVANTTRLYDMSGNVYQWCSDWYSLYSDLVNADNSNPRGPDSGIAKVMRGGYRSLGSADLHLTHRESMSPDESTNFVGFRMVKDNLTAINTPSESEVSVFPNPAKEFLKINSDSELRSVNIYNSEGKLIFSSNENISEIPLKKINSGIYFVCLETEIKTTIRKIVIDK
ncbi:MAG: SUMF1/EgtB/PvdO family nonheme iron enzyme [Paludibacter sp.]|nr:SUMF1/EgtB/PvdO family nonheme iron enzyme [Paludibacter sp.]